MGMGWRPLPRPKVRPSMSQGAAERNTARSKATNLGRLRLLGLPGVEVLGCADASKPADAKAFWRSLGRGMKMGRGHPKIGRNTLIFWNCGDRQLRTMVTQTIQHKLLMPHPNECGRNR